MLDRLPPPWQPNDKPSASHLNALLDSVRQNYNITGGGIAQVWATPDGLTIYVPEQNPPQVQKLKRYDLQSFATGPGKYWLRELSEPTSDVDPTTALTAADLGTAGTTDVLGVNSFEVGGTGHDLDLTSKPQAIFGYDYHVNADGTKVAQIVAIQTEDCVPGSGGGGGTADTTGEAYSAIGV